MATIGRLNILINASIGGLTSGLGAAQKALGGFATAMSGMGGTLAAAGGGMTALAGSLAGMGGTLAAARGGVTALAGSLAGLAGTAGIGFAVKLAADLETTQVAFQQLLGSAGAAQTMLKDLQQFAAKTPFQFKELARGAQQLLSVGFAAREVVPMLTKLGDVAAASPYGAADGLQRIVRALGQIKSKGRVQGEELIQLAEVNIPVWDALAKQLNTTTAEVNRLVSAGKVDAFQGVEAILKLGESSRFAGGLEKQSRTLNGLVSTLKDTATMGLAGFGQSIIDSFGLKDVIRQVTELVETGASKLSAFKPVLEVAGGAFKAAFDLAASGARLYLRVAGQVWETQGQVFAALKEGIGEVFGAFRESAGLSATLTRSWEVFDGVLTGVLDTGKMLGNVLTVGIRDLAAWAKEGARSLGEWLRPMLDFKANFADVRLATISVLEEITVGLSKVGDTVQVVGGFVLHGLADPLAAVGRTVLGILNGLLQVPGALGLNVSGLRDSIGSLSGALEDLRRKQKALGEDWMNVNVGRFEESIRNFFDLVRGINDTPVLGLFGQLTRGFNFVADSFAQLLGVKAGTALADLKPLDYVPNPALEKGSREDVAARAKFMNQSMSGAQGVQKQQLDATKDLGGKLAEIIRLLRGQGPHVKPAQF